MSTTLPHGIIQINEGNISWYGDITANWQLIDSKIGEYDAATQCSARMMPAMFLQIYPLRETALSRSPREDLPSDPLAQIRRHRKQ